ncbi:MAG: adenosine deaminase [Nitrospirae bacterium]|nr:adenosine deaminase [Nitrospirota bacterium]MBI3604749.1 adenosine deaminase [Nitrospirota bacterium]
MAIHPKGGYSVSEIEKVELHQHVDGSIPAGVTWELMKKHGLNPVETLGEMEKLLTLQEDEGGSLLRYLDKFHYPQWITQFYENITRVVESIIEQAYQNRVKLIELRYSPIIHTFAGLTIRQTISSVLTGINRAKDKFGVDAGLIIIAMRHQGPHIAKILARQAIAEAEHLHDRSGVIGFDIAGAERGNPPRLFQEAFKIARLGGLGLTAHAGEDEGPEFIWQSIDDLGVTRIGHGCSAVQDKALMKRLAADKILVECCWTSNYQTGAVKAGGEHPVFEFLDAGVPVAICTDNTTVSGTDQNRENEKLTQRLSMAQIARIHEDARNFSFIKSKKQCGSVRPASVRPVDRSVQRPKRQVRKLRVKP